MSDTLDTGPSGGLRHKGSIMQVPSVGYGRPMVGGENEYERRQNIGGVGLIGARGSIDDGSGGGSAHPVFHTGPWDMEHQYSEIPAHPSSMELLRHEPFHIQDLKGMDYNHHINHHHHGRAGQYDYNNDPSMGPPPPLPPLSGSSGLQTNNRQSYGGTAAFSDSGTATNKDTFSLSKQPPGVHHQQDSAATKDKKDKGKMDDLDLDIYPRLKSPGFVCTKQVTIHVIIMVLAGIVYLAIGGIAGFYIGKTCKYTNILFMSFTIIHGFYQHILVTNDNVKYIDS